MVPEQQRHGRRETDSGSWTRALDDLRAYAELVRA